ncbi:hypothetical protein N431DRAFT_101137 [Stipitochalara longipes BDJ]|nr:hypothetical protein N431DRAFT_101137 [Stipitochalara longipes BDJ]
MPLYSSMNLEVKKGIWCEACRSPLHRRTNIRENQAANQPNQIDCEREVWEGPAAADEEAEEPRDRLASYGDREGTMAMFGGWTGIDLLMCDDDVDFRFVKMPAVQSMIYYWTETVPGTKVLK